MCALVEALQLKIRLCARVSCAVENVASLMWPSAKSVCNTGYNGYSKKTHIPQS